MKVVITNSKTGRTTIYSPSELRRDALAAVKGKGKLVDYFVQVKEGAHGDSTACLVASYKQSDGWVWNLNVSI